MMSRGSERENGADDRQSPKAVAELSSSHAGEWILLRVTERDRFDVPTRGVVVATGKNRGAIQRNVLKRARQAQETGEQYYVFHADNRRASGAA